MEDVAVGGEYVMGAAGLKRLLKVEAVGGHQDVDAFEGEEGGMAFVHVIDGRSDAHDAERAEAADAEDDLLPDASVGIAAVKLVGDVAHLRIGVLREVGIE